MLEQAGVSFTLHTYQYQADADRIGLQAAAALGESPDRVLKTLMALVDEKPVCAILPSDREIAMKKLAAAFGGKSAQMMPPLQAERMTGYKVGGISPFGQMRKVPTVLEVLATSHEWVYLNGGQRGLQVRVGPKEVVRLLDARVSGIVA